NRPTFREDIGTRRVPLDRPAHDLFRVPTPIGGSCIDPVHPQFQRALDGRDRVLIILWTPGKSSTVLTGKCPRTKADRRDEEVACAKLSRLHGLSLPALASAHASRY